MLRQDLQDLDTAELQALRESFGANAKARRTRSMVLSATVLMLGVVLFLAYGFGAVFLAGLTVATLLVSLAEKMTYQRAMDSYERLIHKLVNRVERLEGVSLTRPVDDDVPHLDQLISRRADAASSWGTQPGDTPREATRANVPPAPDAASPHHGYDSSWSDDQRIARHSVSPRRRAANEVIHEPSSN